MLKRLALLLLCACTGCVHHNQLVRHRKSVAECEARWGDVVVAVDAQPVKKELTSTTYVYTSTINKEILELFYRQEMERLGWDLVAINEGAESVALYRKPAQFCVVSVRQLRKRVRVRLDRMKIDNQLLE